MIERFFSRQAHTITGAAIILGAASFLSRIVGLLRDRLFTHYFGAGDILDAYYAAFRIPDFLFNLLLAGAITVGFVPIFLELWDKEKKVAWQVTNNILCLLAVSLGIGSLIAFLFVPQLVHLITPGFTGEKFTLTVELTRIMLLSPIILGISGVVSGVLHALRQFALFAFAPLIYNLGIILGILFLVPIMGPKGLAWGVVLGACLHLLIQIPVLMGNGYRFTIMNQWYDKTVARIIRLVIPRTLGLAMLQVNFMIVDSFASSLSAGSIAIFYLAHNLYYVPIGLIGHSFSLAAFPIFSKYIVEGKPTELVYHFARVVRQVLFLIIPCMLLMIMLRAQIVRVALGSGKFNWANTILTADTLALLGISLAAHCIFLITARALFALHDVWSTFWTSVLGVFLTTLLGFIGKEAFGIRGLAVALSFSIMMQCAVLWFILRRKIGTLGEQDIIYALAKMSIASAGMAFTVQWLKTPIAYFVDMTRLWGILSQGLLCGMVGFFVYGLICYVLKLEEMELFKETFEKRWLKIWHVLE